MRVTQLDAVKRKDSLKSDSLGGLIVLSFRKITARIPLQSPPKGGDSFPLGEAFMPAAQGGHIGPPLRR